LVREMGMRCGERPHLLAVLGGAILVGWVLGRRRPHEVQPTLGTICQVSALPFPSLWRPWQLGA
jgi:hypothetical protein